jgi:hypothetical protein
MCERSNDQIALFSTFFFFFFFCIYTRHKTINTEMKMMPTQLDWKDLGEVVFLI